MRIDGAIAPGGAIALLEANQELYSQEEKVRGNRVLSDYGAVHYSDRYALAGLAMPLGALRASLTLLGALAGTQGPARGARGLSGRSGASWGGSGWTL